MMDLLFRVMACSSVLDNACIYILPLTFNCSRDPNLPFENRSYVITGFRLCSRCAETGNYRNYRRGTQDVVAILCLSASTNSTCFYCKRVGTKTSSGV